MKKKYGRHIAPNFKNENLCPVFLPFFGRFLAVFLIFGVFPQKFDPSVLHGWKALEISFPTIPSPSL